MGTAMPDLGMGAKGATSRGLRPSAGASLGRLARPDILLTEYSVWPTIWQGRPDSRRRRRHGRGVSTSGLRAKMTPEARSRAGARVLATLKQLPLLELRKARSLSQERLAKALQRRKARSPRSSIEPTCTSARRLGLRETADVDGRIRQALPSGTAHPCCRWQLPRVALTRGSA